MAKQLVITEKPSVARDVAKALGGFSDEGEYLESDDYVVTWALGHLLRLAEPEHYHKEWKSWAIKNLPMIPDSFAIQPREGQKKRLDLIKRLGKRKDVDAIVNACDAGREGEMIYRRIAEWAQLDKKPQYRLWMQSMTQTAIRDAFQQLRPGSELDNLGHAAWLRSVGDWLIGMNATRALTQRLRSGKVTSAWSAGRVQTPTLKILVDREREILAHEPRDYWEITANFEHDGHAWIGRWIDPDYTKSDDRDVKPTRIFDRARAERVIAAVQAAERAPAREKRRKSKQKPPMLFDLTTLQREANRRFGMSAKRTLDAAQRLYEGHKVLTYPRTDARTLPDDYGPTVTQVLDSLGGMELEIEGVTEIAQRVLKDGPQNLDKVLDSKGVSDHFAIVPTGTPPSESLGGDDARIFEIVVRQFLAALMGPATWAVVERFVDVAGESGAETFRTNARSLEVAGFLEALGTEAGTGTSLPPLVAGQDTASGVSVAVTGFEEEAKETRPPPRYSEAQLLRMMETAGEQIEEDELSEVMRGRGIGTPATRANIIEELVRKTYARRVDKRLAPTSKAMRLMDILDRAEVPGLASPKLTGEWEHSLARVAGGETSRDAVFQRLVDYTRSVVDRLVGFEHQTLYDGTDSLGTCPECGETTGAQVYESSWGYACERNTGRDSECMFIMWKDRGGRYIDRKLARLLIAERKVEDVTGLVSLSGQEQIATMDLVKKLVKIKGKRGAPDTEEERWVVDLDYGNNPVGDAGPEVVVRVLVPSDDPEKEVLVTDRRYVTRAMFEGKVEKGLPQLPRVVCHRDMEEEEALAFFNEGKTPLLQNFISKRGRPFRATLLQRESGKHKFEFPPREPRAKKTTAKKTPAKKTTAKKTPAKKTTAKKTPAKKTTARKTPAKKATAKKTTTRKTSSTAKKATPSTNGSSNGTPPADGGAGASA